MTEPTPHVVRLEQICAALHGKVLDHDDDVAEIEIPMDLAGAALNNCALAGFRPVRIGQSQRYVARRVTTMAGTMVIDPAAMDLMTFVRYRVQLAGHAPRTEDKPSAAIAITRPVGPGR